MISHFTVLGGLYQFKSYSTACSDWGSYPWLAGLDNRIEITSSMAAQSSRTRVGDISGSGWRSEALTTGVSSIVFSVNFTLLRIDQWGNSGSEVGASPDELPPEYLCPYPVSSSVISVSSVSTFIDLNPGAESQSDPTITVLSASVSGTDSILRLINVDSNAEDSTNLSDMLSLGSASVVSISSEAV